MVRRLSSEADAAEWTWYKLQEAVTANTPARAEAQRELAVLARLLKAEVKDGGPFGRKYDERDIMQQVTVERCLVAVGGLLSAAATLEDCASAALVVHASDEARMTFAHDLDEARAAGEALRTMLASELLQVEADRDKAWAEVLAAKLTNESALEEAAERQAYTEGLEVRAAQHDADIEEAVSTFDSVRLSLSLEIAQLRDDVIRGSEALHSLAEEHEMLSEGFVKLRLENEVLRQELTRRMHGEHASSDVADAEPDQGYLWEQAILASGGSLRGPRLARNRTADHVRQQSTVPYTTPGGVKY